MERIRMRQVAAPLSEPGRVLAAYREGVTAICQLAARFGPGDWARRTPCQDWHAADLAGHVRCVADDLHEYLDQAPASRYARLMATGAPAEWLARRLARQNAAGLAALGDAPPGQHVVAFAAAARGYAARVAAVWDLPHHQYRDMVVTVGAMAGAACTEWHLHAWDLASALGVEYRPASPVVLADCWRAGMPHLPVPVPRPGWRTGPGRRLARGDPWQVVLAASGRLTLAGRRVSQGGTATLPT